jgi:signal transduction histidine kinase
MLESGALMTDDTGELIMINSIARELLGLGETGTVTMQDISQLKSDKDIASMIRVTYAESKSQAEEVTVGGEGGRKIKVNVALVTDPNGMKIGTVAVFREL